MAVLSLDQFEGLRAVPGDPGHVVEVGLNEADVGRLRALVAAFSADGDPASVGEVVRASIRALHRRECRGGDAVASLQDGRSARQ